MISDYIREHGDTVCIEVDDVFRRSLFERILARSNCRRQGSYEYRQMLKEYLVGMSDIHAREYLSIVIDSDFTFELTYEKDYDWRHFEYLDVKFSLSVSINTDKRVVITLPYEFFIGNTLCFRQRKIIKVEYDKH